MDFLVAWHVTPSVPVPPPMHLKPRPASQLLALKQSLFRFYSDTPKRRQHAQLWARSNIKGTKTLCNFPKALRITTLTLHSLH